MLSKKWSKTYYLSSYSVDVLSSGNDFTSANKDVDVIEIFLKHPKVQQQQHRAQL